MRILFYGGLGHGDSKIAEDNTLLALLGDNGNLHEGDGKAC